MPAHLQTPRGPYTLSLAREPARSTDRVILTLSLESTDGMERVAMRFMVASAMAKPGDEQAAIERIAVWIAAEFERVREAALRSVRAKRRVLLIPIGSDWRGQL